MTAAGQQHNPVPIESINDDMSDVLELHDLFIGCNHRHSPTHGPHLARETAKGEFAFSNGNFQLVGKDGKSVRINRLHAAAMSHVFSIAFLNTQFTESCSKRMEFPLFTSMEILDALEMSNWVCYTSIEYKSAPSFSHIEMPCAFNILRVAAFFQLDQLLAVIRQRIETQVTPERLLEAYRLSEVTDSYLAERLWQRVLSSFSSLYQNGTYVYLSPKEIKECFMDAKLNIRNSHDSQILEAYIKADVPGFSTTSKIQRKKEIAEIFGAGAATTIGSLGSATSFRIPHEVIIAQSGWGVNGPTSKMEVFDYHRSEWILPTTPNLEEIGRAYHGIAATNNGILCMGGFNGRTYYRSTALYRYDSMLWEPVCAMVNPRCYVSLSKLDESHVIACGGYTGTNRLRTTEIYKFDENQWIKAGTMNVIRSDARGITIPESNRVYVVGGFDGRQCHRSLEYYCAERDEWIMEQGFMSSTRSGVGAVAINPNVIVAVGGFNGTHRLSSTEMYDIRTGIWHPLTGMNISRSNFGNACLEEEPWVIGGYNADRTIPDCERFDMRLNQWIIAPSMNISRSAVACCIVQNVDWIEKIFETQPSTSTDLT